MGSDTLRRSDRDTCHSEERSDEESRYTRKQDLGLCSKRFFAALRMTVCDKCLTNTVFLLFSISETSEILYLQYSNQVVLVSYP